MAVSRICRFLVCPDSFKGTFGADEVAAAVGRGVRAGGGEADLCPVADGGEGTAAVLAAALGGRRLEAAAHDPLGRELRAGFVLLGNGGTAAVEVAAASGLPLVSEDERDPERADTRGTGELILAAVAAGAGTVLVSAGGSATTDGGRGAIETIRDGGGLGDAAIEVLCDVTAPYEDAARVFAPQKGADAATVERLRRRLDQFAATLPRDPRGVPMGGCAGGLSGGLMAAFGAKLRAGAPFVLDAVGFDRRLAGATAAIAGEGRIDSQSLGGKIVGEVARRCAAAGVPLHALVGRDALGPELAREHGIVSIAEATTLPAIEEAGRRLAQHG
jgi:glycerate kinase